MFNHYHDPILIVDKTLKINHFNHMFERMMKKINPKGRYDHIGDFLDDDSLVDLRTKVLECIKDQKYCSTKFDIKDRHEAFHCNLQPLYWKGSK